MPTYRIIDLLVYVQHIVETRPKKTQNLEKSFLARTLVGIKRASEYIICSVNIRWVNKKPDDILNVYFYDTYETHARERSTSGRKGSKQPRDKVAQKWCFGAKLSRSSQRQTKLRQTVHKAPASTTSLRESQPQKMHDKSSLSPLPGNVGRLREKRKRLTTLQQPSASKPKLPASRRSRQRRELRPRLLPPR